MKAKNVYYSNLVFQHTAYRQLPPYDRWKLSSLHRYYNIYCSFYWKFI